MKSNQFVYGQLLSVFLHLLDDKEKRKPAVIKLNDAIRRVHHKPKIDRDETYYRSADIVEYAIKQSWEELQEGKQITINAICWLIYNRHKEELKPYKLNKRFFEAMSRAGVSGFALESAKTLNIIEKYIIEKMNDV